jgi:hypothetical protein
MKTSVLIALLAVSFTAVLAAHQQNRISVHKIHVNNLKQIALPKLAIASKSAIGDLIELIGLIIGIDVNAIIEQAGLTLSEVEAALNDATVELIELSARVDEQLAQELKAVINGALEEALVIAQPLLDIINKLIPGTNVHHAFITPNGLIDELLKLLIGLTVEELTTLVETTITDLEVLAGKTLTTINDIALRLSAELQAETDHIIAEAEARIVAAVQPLLDLLAPILPPAKSNAITAVVDLPELINTISESFVATKYGVAFARSALLELLADTPAAKSVDAIYVKAEADSLAAFEAANGRLLTTAAEEIPALVQATIDNLFNIFDVAGVDIQIVVYREAPELIHDIWDIGLALAAYTLRAVDPVIQLISRSESKAVVILSNFYQRRGLRYAL